MNCPGRQEALRYTNTRDSLIRRNIFTRTLRADHLWMDVGNENNRITRNLFLEGKEQREAIFIECSRDGINLIDNNIYCRTWKDVSARRMFLQSPVLQAGIRWKRQV